MRKSEKQKILDNHAELLEKLREERVVSVEMFDNGKLFLLEQCDQYFSYLLTREDCIELSELFKELSEVV